MVKVRKRGEIVRLYVLENVEHWPRDIATKTAEHFSITRQAVNKHLARLVKEGALAMEGKTAGRAYRLCTTQTTQKAYQIDAALTEDLAWRELMQPYVADLPDNVATIWHHGFTEMFNNAIDHSGGTVITVSVERTAMSTTVHISDDGIGIFRKIQQALGLLDERHSVLELAKGKLTTDPAHHTGEGIFFTSRMMEDFQILSGGSYFSHRHGEERDWLLEREKPAPGTLVAMKLNNHTARTTIGIFNEYTSGEPDDRSFSKTVVPVRLAQYGDDNLVSRSQAKRLLARVDRFKTVVLDFADVASIGPSFADEIFRVFANQHPEIDLYAMGANTDVQDMVLRAQNARHKATG